MRNLRKKLLLLALTAGCAVTAFAGVNAEKVAAYTADAEATEIVYDFETETQTDMTEMALGGWTVVDGKYHPSQAGALYNASAFRLTDPFDLTGTKYISMDFYTTAKTFDIGFLDTAAANMWGNALFIHLPFSDGNIGVNSYVDCTAGTYYGGSTIKVMDGLPHNIKLVISEGKISYVLDGEPFVCNNGVAEFNAPSNSAYLLIRAVGTESYIDNLIISDTDIEYVPPVIDNSYEEAELDFSQELDGAKYFKTLDVNGWAVKDGVFSPEYMPWSSTYLTQPIDLREEKYISFDFLAIKDNGDETQSQFNVMFLSNLDKYTCAGAIHCFMETSTPVVTVNKAMGKDRWVGTSSFDWTDGKYHNLMIIIKDNQMQFEIDGESVVDNVLKNPIVLEIDSTDLEKEIYFGLQATNVMTRIDNFKIKNTYTEYVAPVPEEEITFEELSKDFAAGEATGFVQYNDSTNWAVNADGKLAPINNWSKAYFDQAIPLTEEKTLTVTFKLSEANSGHQFTIGLSTDKNSYYGLYVIFYQGSLLLNYGTAPQVRLIDQTSNVWFDNAEHTLKMIVKNNKVAVLIDGEVIFKDVQAAMRKGYFTVQSSLTADCIDNLTIINRAEPLSKPNPDGDIASKPIVSAPVVNEVSGKVEKQGVWVALTIVFSVLAVGLAGTFVFLLVKKRR